MTRTGKYPEEIRREAVRLVRAHRDEYDSEWAAITSVASIVRGGSADGSQLDSSC